LAFGIWTLPARCQAGNRGAIILTMDVCVKNPGLTESLALHDPHLRQPSPEEGCRYDQSG
jgi:hypothetical protein